MIEDAVKTSLVEGFFQRNSYSWLDRMFERWRYKLYFTESGKTRFASIAGYILGMYHMGNREFAETLAESIIENLDRLAGNTIEITCNTALLTSFDSCDDTLTVQGSKCILSDDGTWGGFSLLWLHPVHPDKYRQTYQKYMLQHEDDHSFTSPTHQTHEELRIRERVDANNRYSEEITQYVWSKKNNQALNVYYAPSYNGGLLYHGPGAGETFAVTLNKCLWSVHT